MNILFIGYAVNSDKIGDCTGGSIAGNKMQLNVLKGLMEKNKIRAISILPIAAFPKDRNLYIKESDADVFDNLRTRIISYVNFPIIKQVWQTISVYRTAKKMIEKDTVIFTFNLFPQVGLPMKWLKRKYRCRTVALLADLPIDDKISRNWISFVFRNIFDVFTLKAIKACDKLIVLNKNAISKYAPNADFLVIEGGFDVHEDIYLPNIIKTKRNMIYSGALTEYSGITSLIEAMKYVENKDAFLEIYGSGELEKYVKYSSENMSNVIYRGKVDNETMRKRQREAYLLVNPRLLSDPISMVTFPSKIFEYMVSGTPVLSTKLSGFSDEYLDKMFIVETNNPKDLSFMINKIMEMSADELKLISNKAREFILEHKTWEKQSTKIDEFINSDIKKDGNK